MSSTLTKGEICASYRQAKKPEKQILILAQLCGYPVEKIENILRSCGFAVKSSGRVKRAEIHWTTYKYREHHGLKVTGPPRPPASGNAVLRSA